jgi:hypothetical protein
MTGLYTRNGSNPTPLPEALPGEGGILSYAPHDESTIAFSGYLEAPAKPPPSGPDKVVEWDNGWVERDFNATEQDSLWASVRSERDRRMAAFDWRVLRCQREARTGVTPTTDDMVALDSYMNALANITEAFETPWSVVWPVPPT